MKVKVMVTLGGVGLKDDIMRLYQTGFLAILLAILANHFDKEYYKCVAFATYYTLKRNKFLV